MTSSLRVTSLGVPRAISRPWWNTTTRSASETMTSMMCSTMTRVMPRPWIWRTKSMAARISAGVRPAMASSSSSTLGSQASALAISSRLRPGVPRLLAGASATPASPTSPMICSALSRAAAAAGWRRNAPIITLSSTDIDSNVSGTWKVRAMPRRARASGANRVTSRPSKCTVPEVGCRSPVRQLKKVDLPAPLGPMRPKTSPSMTATEASSTALNAPKAIVSWRASSSMAGLGFGALGRRPHARSEQGQQSARQEASDDDDDGAIDHERKPRAFATEQAVGNLLQRHQDQRPDERPKQQARPTERGHDEHLDRDQYAAARLRIDEAEHDGIERAGHRREAGAQHIGVELVATGCDTERTGRTLRILDGAQIEPHAALLDAPRDEQDGRQHRKKDVVIGHCRGER